MTDTASTQGFTFESLLEAVQPETGGREILDPATGELVGRVFVPSVSALDEAVATAEQAQPAWAGLGHDERSRLLALAADAVEANAEPLAQLLSREQGKPLNGPNARFEVGACASWLRATASFEFTPEVLVDDGQTYAELHYRPLGVVGAIGPWNWPMMISVWQLAPALRMGNSVIMKPSEYTPLSVLALAEVLNTVLPEGVLQVVAGDGAVGEAMSTHSDIDKIMFTGSISTGKAIIGSSAGNVKRLTMELGGNDAGIVLPDADPKAIAEGLFWGAFINTGQTCAALKRLYVHTDIYDEVCRALTDFAAKVPMGNGRDERNELGPLQNKAQFDIVDSLVESAKSSGAKVILGGDPDREAAGYFYPTTLIADIDPQNPLVTEEQFGPALPIIRYDDVDEAVDLANSLEVGLGSSVWSSDRSAAVEVAARLEAGTTWINSHGGIDPRIPFGGAKQSGYGLEFGVHGLKGLGQPHVVVG
ncbi:aldehyde dehydrogenase family protein [Brevibacterium sp. 'Marine']|uniref:aldehyde dehydrogenase family protein n=1 Tax=Brevibacterium sp. 'Marine' TaxID=2725563 RepID=UPI00145CFF7A|nr:aldehyde dehydrogenase family protein [Brevibacterium sp. 'Marine']